jgi:hypothetical protein
MRLELEVLCAAGVGYLIVLFLVAYATERGIIPARIAKHPLTSALALGVYASSWSFNGSVGFARTEGYRFLAIYLGVTLACLLMPVVWKPIARLTREYQLTSLADLFVFRYRGQLVGVLVTLFMLAGSLPYLALEIRAITESVQGNAEKTNLIQREKEIAIRLQNVDAKKRSLALEQDQARAEADQSRCVAEYSAMLMHSTEGKCYSTAEMEEYLGETGFAGARFIPTAAGRSVILARKPA